MEHITRIPVRHPQIVAAGRHDGIPVPTRVPHDPEVHGRLATPACGSPRPTRCHQDQPAGDLPRHEVAAGRVRCVPRGGERPAASTDRRHPGPAADHRTRAFARTALRALRRRPRADPAGKHRPDRAIRLSALLQPAQARRDQGVGPRGAKTSWSSSPTSMPEHHARRGRQHRQPGRWSWPGMRCLPRASPGSSSPATPATPTTPARRPAHQPRHRLTRPRPRSWRWGPTPRRG